MNQSIENVLRFWFGNTADARSVGKQQSALWWSKDEATDALIKREFELVTIGVANGSLGSWLNSADGVLASVIATDQFPRNIWRGDARSFSYDKVALSIARYAVSRCLDSNMRMIDRVFLYLPFEHSESMADQETSIRLYSQLLDEAVDDEKELFAGYLDFARKHAEIIERFSRYPHRNLILARPSSAEETEFMQQPGSSF